jgi:1-acyl-sn-glycerol-3-phosphate acyltransferase
MTLFLLQVLFFLDEIVAYYLIGKKRWYGWLVKLFGLIPVTAINIICDLPVFHALNAFFLALYIKNIWDWRRVDAVRV